MTRSNHSDSWHDQLVDYVLGNLSPDAESALLEYVADHPALAKELAELQESLSALPYALPSNVLSAELKQSILMAATQEAQEDQDSSASLSAADHRQPQSRLVQPKRTMDKQRLLRWMPLAGAIAASLIVVLGIDNYRLRQSMAKSAQLQQSLQNALQQNQLELDQLQKQVQNVVPVVTSLREPNSIVYPLVGTGPAKGATARLVAVPGHQSMVLVSENMPTLTNNQIYRLWAIADTDASEPPQYCGQFRTTQNAIAEWTAPTAICSEMPEQVVITLDRPNDPIDSAGPLVMQSQT
ncbi:MAG: anti-sigma factor [Leptolyngbyaceae bacterium]|nr:anti-sigma factor [Leptolyngbyaceae bacterium]